MSLETFDLVVDDMPNVIDFDMYSHMEGSMGNNLKCHEVYECYESLPLYIENDAMKNNTCGGYSGIYARTLIGDLEIHGQMYTCHDVGLDESVILATKCFEKIFCVQGKQCDIGCSSCDTKCYEKEIMPKIMANIHAIEYNVIEVKGLQFQVYDRGKNLMLNVDITWLFDPRIQVCCLCLMCMNELDEW